MSSRTFTIRKRFIYKGHIFLLSVFEGSGFWTTHVYEGNEQITYAQVVNHFQKSHDRQMEGLIQERDKKIEAEEFIETSVTDITAKHFNNEQAN